MSSGTTDSSTFSASICSTGVSSVSTSITSSSFLSSFTSSSSAITSSPEDEVKLLGSVANAVSLAIDSTNEPVESSEAITGADIGAALGACSISTNDEERSTSTFFFVFWLTPSTITSSVSKIISIAILLSSPFLFSPLT